MSGKFNKVNFTFTMPCSITSSQKNAYLTNCVVKYENVDSTSYSDVSNLKFTVDIEKHPCVYVVYSSHVNVFDCNAVGFSVDGGDYASGSLRCRKG